MDVDVITIQGTHTFDAFIRKKSSKLKALLGFLIGLEMKGFSIVHLGPFRKLSRFWAKMR